MICGKAGGYGEVEANKRVIVSVTCVRGCFRSGVGV